MNKRHVILAVLAPFTWKCKKLLNEEFSIFYKDPKWQIIMAKDFLPNFCVPRRRIEHYAYLICCWMAISMCSYIPINEQCSALYSLLQTTQVVFCMAYCSSESVHHEFWISCKRNVAVEANEGWVKEQNGARELAWPQPLQGITKDLQVEEIMALPIPDTLWKGQTLSGLCSDGWK